MYTYTLEKEDFVRSLLYAASQSKQIFRSRVRSWMLFSAGFLGLGFVLLGVDRFLAEYFIIIGFICLVFYPFYTRWRYKRLYTKRVERNFKNRFGVNIDLFIDPEHLRTKDPSGETSINTKDILQVDEISKNLLIRTKTGPTLILPVKMAGYQAVRSAIQEIANQQNIPWLDKPHWRWK